MDKLKNGVLLIAFHYPPIAVSSGVHRTLAFSRYLSQWGWNVDVLTADYRVYPRYDLSSLETIPSEVNVISAWAKDTARDLSIKGRYSQLMAIPDRYQSWIVGGVLSGLKVIKKNRPSIIFSTYPIASAHVIGYLLHKFTGIPWVADFRDPMAQEGYPENPLVKKSYLWIERKIVKHASKLIFNTSGALEYYIERYSSLKRERCLVIQNGFDEEVFDEIEKAVADEKITGFEDSNKFILLHSGVIYPSERDPTQLFDALSQLKKDLVVNKSNFSLRLRATGHDNLFREMIVERDIADLIELAPPIPHKEALKEMFKVNGLLLLQADNCEQQIPAKAFEYIRAGKPVLALTTRTGETGKLIAGHPLSEIAPLNSADDIMSALKALIERPHEIAQESQLDTSKYSRRHGAQLLKVVLEQTKL